MGLLRRAISADRLLGRLSESQASGAQPGQAQNTINEWRWHTGEFAHVVGRRRELLVLRCAAAVGISRYLRSLDGRSLHLRAITFKDLTDLTRAFVGGYLRFGESGVDSFRICCTPL